VSSTWLQAGAGSRRRIAWRIAVLPALAVLLSGCVSENLGSLLSKPANVTTASTAGMRAPVMVALKPVVGPPQSVLGEFARQLDEAARKADVALLIDADAKAPLTLHTYLIAERKGDRVEVLYIWDISNEAGERVRRVSGEEAVPAVQGGDAWASLTPAVTRPLAEKAIAALQSTVKG
jgi:hypothetical protein